MSHAGEEVSRLVPGGAVAHYEDASADFEWADLRSAVSWARNHRVLVAAIVLIVAQVAWKGQLLSHLYFRQDDFHDLDLAVDHPFNWSYLSFIGSGHLIIGLRIIAWPLVRVASTPYNWALASTVSLAFVAAASVAALRLLRDLFGERPAILIPLIVYLLTPLTIPDLGIWSSAMESVPLQLATFMALSAHLRYVRTGRTPHLAAAACWIVFGMIFFEKGIVLPLLLFAITAGFLTERRSLLAGSLRSLRGFWKAWVLYAVLVIGYLAILMVALRTSASQPKVPLSSAGVLTFVWELVRDTFLPGAIGGPWQWFPVPGGSFSFAAPPPSLVALSVIVGVVVVAVSIWLRAYAWRAWLIVAGWVVAADMLPVVIGRLNTFNPSVLGLETRYVADATPVLAVCIGLAFLPIAAGSELPSRPARGRRRMVLDAQTLRSAVAAFVAVFIFGSIWSVQAYENVTNGSEAADYIANATLALKDAPAGTPVVDRPMPQNIVEGTFEAYAYTSKVVGYMQRGKLAGKLDWIGRPNGTVDGLQVFGTDGRLHQAQVFGTKITAAPARACFPKRRGKIAVTFTYPSPAFSGAVRIGYFWYSPEPATVYVRYGTAVLPLDVRPGLHAGYLPVRGKADGLVIEGLNGFRMCVGDVEAGNLGPSPFGPAIPPLPTAG